MKEIGSRAASEEPSLPLIYFDSTTFESNGQTNYKPVLAVEAWVTREDASSYLDGDLTEQQLVSGDKPKKKSRKKKK